MAQHYHAFKTGATRTAFENKIDYEAFLSAPAMKRFGKYMHKHRKRADGSMRDGDNWQLGIPKKSYVKSIWRHFFMVWAGYRNGKFSEEQLCALLFNVQGLLHEVIKDKAKSKIIKRKRENILH